MYGEYGPLAGYLRHGLRLDSRRLKRLRETFLEPN